MLSLAAANGFEAGITKDTGMPYEQNAQPLPCSIVILEAPTHALDDIRPLVPALLQCLRTLSPRTVARVK
jgi:hypothetical protein